MRARPLALLLLTAVATTGSAADREEFRVVVAAAAPVETLSRKQLSEIFLKKVIAWPGGEVIEPVEPPDRSPLREQFCQAVHGKSSAALRVHWTKVMFAGEDAPPVTRATDAELLTFVRTTPGAIGYVSAGATLGPGVKLVRVTP